MTTYFDLKSFRKHNCLSQAELADFLGVGQSFISKVEKGVNPLPKDKLDMILSNPNWDSSLDVVKGDEPNAAPPSSPDVASLLRENELLRSQIEDLKREKAAYWELIVKLTQNSSVPPVALGNQINL